MCPWSLTICQVNSQRSERWNRIRRQVVYRWARHNCGELLQSTRCRGVDGSRGDDRSYVLGLVPVPSWQFFFLLDEKWTWHFCSFVFVATNSTSVSCFSVWQFMCVFQVFSLCCCHSHTGCVLICHKHRFQSRSCCFWADANSVNHWQKMTTVHQFKAIWKLILFLGTH